MKKGLIIFICLVILSPPVLAQEDILLKARQIISMQEEIESFQADISLEISNKLQQKSRFLFTYYYQKPDFIHLETKDFVLLPTEPLQSLRPDFLELKKYNYTYLGAEDAYHLIELKPKNQEGTYRLILWLDLKAQLIKKAYIFLQMGNFPQEFKIEVKYQKLGNYSLPASIQGELAIPTKFDLKGEILDYQEGEFRLELKNYQLNQGLPAKILQKKG